MPEIDDDEDEIEEEVEPVGEEGGLSDCSVSVLDWDDGGEEEEQLLTGDGGRGGLAWVDLGLVSW